MVTLTCVSKVKDGYALKDITVKSLDMNQIISTFRKEVGWGFNTTDFEIFKHGKAYWENIAQHTSRGWVYININVKGWDKYAVPSFVKKVKSNPYYSKE